MVLAMAAASAVEEPGHAAHQRVGQHVDVPEAAAEMADEARSQRDQALGDAADIHQPRRQHEERNGEQQVIESVGHALRHRQQRQLALRQERDESAEDQRIDDRDAEQHQADRDDDERPDDAEGADQVRPGGAFQGEIERNAGKRCDQRRGPLSGSR